MDFSRDFWFISGAVTALAVLLWLATRAFLRLQNSVSDQQQQGLQWQQALAQRLNEAEQQQQQAHAELRRELTQAIRGEAQQQRNELRIVQQQLELQLQQAARHQHEDQQQQQTRQDDFRKELTQQLLRSAEATDQRLQELRQQQHTAMHDMRQELQQALTTAAEVSDKRLLAMQQQQRDSLQHMTREFAELRDQMLAQLLSMRQAQEKQLDNIRHTVDEKLQGTLEKRLGESFRQVSKQLEMVHQGLGEMQQLATGVGDLKRVLGNVKTRGILGEYQLGNLLEQMLAPEQYAADVKTRRGSQNVVEYAVRLPGRDDHGSVWLPIDSKFPLESYQLLLNAREQGDSTAMDRASAELRQRITSFARDIHDKYLDPPNTTDFAIMFLPVEGLYAEVLQDPGMFELLQRKYRITITGPTTLAALLNSLHMGFRTLAVQQRSSEVWRVLADVREEFGRFAGQLEKVYKQLDTAQKSLDVLRHTRTNVMQRKLQQVQQLDADSTALPLEETGGDDDEH